jgi:putative ABC transport system permease protein
LLLLGLTALALTALVFLLSFRLREREMQTYAKIGARTATIVMLKSAEVAIVLISGTVLALLSAAITKSFSAGLLPQLLN